MKYFISIILFLVIILAYIIVDDYADTKFYYEDKIQTNKQQFNTYIKQVNAEIELDKVKLDEVKSKMNNKEHLYAVWTLGAAKLYKLDHKTLACLINSESGYTKITHKLPYVKGMSGINTKVWNLDIANEKEEIYAGAYVLRKYMDKYKGDELKAITGYKGYSALGKRQAQLVLNCKDDK